MSCLVEGPGLIKWWPIPPVVVVREQSLVIDGWRLGENVGESIIDCVQLATKTAPQDWAIDVIPKPPHFIGKAIVQIVATY